MINFLNNNLYIMMFIFILLSFSLINVTKGKNFIIMHRSKIALIFAFFQLVIYAINLSRSLSAGLWYHLLLTDLCPLISFLSIIIFVTDKDKYYKMLMPWLLIGASITMLASGADIAKNLWMLPSFFEHIFMLTQGFLAYIWISKYQKKEFLLILIIPAALIIWIMLVGYLPWQVTGDPAWAVFSTALLEPAIFPTLVYYGYDIKGYEIITVYEILGQLNMPYPIPTIIFYTIALGLAYLIAYSKTTLPKITERFLTLFNVNNKNRQIKSQELKQLQL